MSEEYTDLPNVCHYCGCPFHEGDEVSVVQKGTVQNFQSNDVFELTTSSEGTKLFHKFCKFMKEEKNNNSTPIDIIARDSKGDYRD